MPAWMKNPRQNLKITKQSQVSSTSSVSEIQVPIKRRIQYTQPKKQNKYQPIYRNKQPRYEQS
jgi:hypothetical protein